MAKKSGLGKGFGSLLPDDFDKSILLDKKDQIQKVSMADIQPNPDQPRRHFDEENLRELAASIKQYGVLQPLVVTPEGEKYTIIAGERRYRAAKKAGLNQLPVLVRTSAELERLEIGLIENVQRVDLSPLEQAASIAKLHEQFDKSYEEIARRLGKAHSTITNTVRLLQLPDIAKKALADGKISEGHARSVLALKGNDSAQRELIDNIVHSRWSVRQAEQFAAARKKGAEPKTTQKSVNTEDNPQLAHFLKSPVAVKKNRRGGVIQIKFANDSELKRIIKQILS